MFALATSNKGEDLLYLITAKLHIREEQTSLPNWSKRQSCYYMNNSASEAFCPSEGGWFSFYVIMLFKMCTCMYLHAFVKALSCLFLFFHEVRARQRELWNMQRQKCWEWKWRHKINGWSCQQSKKPTQEGMATWRKFIKCEIVSLLTREQMNKFVMSKLLISARHFSSSQIRSFMDNILLGWVWMETRKTMTAACSLLNIIISTIAVAKATEHLCLLQ